MITLLNYTLTKLIYDSPNSLVYRAVRNDNQRPVILKQLKADYPTPAELTRYCHEFEILSQLKLPGVIQAYELKPYQNTLLLVVEDFGGDSLKALIPQNRLTLTELLSIFIQSADSLGQLHATNIIHKDINPANLVWNRDTGQLKVVDFGTSTQLPRETPTLKSPNVLEGTLAYISPEQTGRMNRNLDYRTDFYSLGVTFYELLTHQLPFSTEDDLELIHCHIAKLPLSPAELNPAIPHILSAVVMKLMAKNAEDRYQSAFGVKYDLEQILANLKGLENWSGFKLAQHDFSTHFHLPQKLYGREEEIQHILTAFDTVMQGCRQLLLVAGYSGIGKSALVQEIYKPITRKRGYFIAGKFDQFQRNVPYSAVIQAFRDLVQQLLTEPQSRLDTWKTQIMAAVGNNGQVLSELIPEMVLILGPQPAVPTLPPTEAQNRFNLVFQNFIKVFCQADHPLVIFLDDLQWIDSASLKLLTLMMNDIPYLFLIGAYRDNEVSPVHPLMTTLDDLQKGGHQVQTVTLSPLTLLHLNQLVRDILHLPLERTLPLAELVLKKTGGNPFFMGEFLKTLYVEHLLEFNLQDREWQWDLAQIKARNITDNVVELMTGKIQRLPAPTQVILTLAASIGNQFDLATLAVISQQPEEPVKTALWEALKEGLVVPLAENYKFVHDRIQQAAYSLIPAADRPALHWQIGQLLKTHWGENLGERLFEIVDHLNQGSSLATTPEANMPLVRLNLQAGQRAKLATAYQMAAKYLRSSQLWLTPKHWQTAYELTLSVHLELVEVMYLCGDFDQMEAVAELVLQQASTHLDKVKIYEIRVQAYIGQALLFKALQTAREGLSLFGVELPEKPTPAEVDRALAETATKWQGVPISEWVHLPRMTAPNRLAAVRLLSIIMPASYQGMPELFPLVVSKMINLSIESGNSELSPFLYACYGMFLCGAMEIEAGYQFGQLAIQVIEHLNIQVHRARALEIVNGFINPWKERLSLPTQRLKEIYQLGIEEGDVEFGGYAALIHCECAHFCGLPLAELESAQASYIPILTRLKQNTSVNYLKIYLQTTLNLCSLVSPPSNSATDPLEDSEMPFLVSEQDKEAYGFHFYTNRLCLCYLFYKPHQALEYALLAKRYPAASSGNFVVAFFHFYESLSYLAIYSDTPSIKRKEILQQVAANQNKMKLWAHHAPMNCQHKYDLVEAEKARVLGQKWEAAEYYEKAITGARENEYLQEEALTYELAARFYLNQGMEKFAQAYLQEALYRYQRWGALAKVKQLEQNYPQFLTRTSTTSRFKGTVVATRLSTGRDSDLDLTTVMKASQAISGEIVLDKLLIALMKIIIQNAGAQTGYLILVNQGKLVIEATGTIEVEPIGLHSQPLENCPSLSQTIVNYVARTKQRVVLENATKTGQFIHDAYVKQHQPKSILCVPLINQGKLVSIVYLENNLTTDAFTEERVELLNLLSSQAAISIENARLYTNLATLNRAYERFVPRELLHLLGKDSITQVKLGDQVQKEMSILFADIRSFTSLSEKMSPADNFKFINAYLSRMQPVIHQHHGFIDKYVGDAIMALFSGDADDAVQAGIAMLHKLTEYNQHRQRSDYIPIQIGIGINTGLLMLGTVGGEERMDGTVISDAVNLASRVEGMTKMYGATLLITEHTYSRLRYASQYTMREIDKVQVKGKAQPITVYEVFEGETLERIALKRQTLIPFEQGLIHYRSQEFTAAITGFQQVLQRDATDQAAQLYLKRCQYFQQHGVAAGWEGVMALETK